MPLERVSAAGIRTVLRDALFQMVEMQSCCGAQGTRLTATCEASDLRHLNGEGRSRCASELELWGSLGCLLRGALPFYLIKTAGERSFKDPAAQHRTPPASSTAEEIFSTSARSMDAVNGEVSARW
jgi:hypothetical protein